MSQLDVLIDGYWRFLRDKTALREIDEWTEITTPYLDRHNDYIQIYARREGNDFVLSDGGDTLVDLEQTGLTLDSPRRQAILRSILNGFGVSQTGDAFVVHATPDNFSLRKHNLIQAMLSVNDMFVLASPTVESLFFEDVACWLESADVRFSPRVKFAGKSGFDHMFDFVIPKSRSAPERIIRTINNPNRTTALTYITAWVDTRESRADDAQPIAFLNDNERTVGGNVTDALTSYGITAVPWSLRERFRGPLAA